MSSISPLGGSFGGPTNICGSQSSHHGGPAKKFDANLTSFLQSKGVSADEQKSIKSDLVDAIKSTLSSGTTPDPTSIQKTIEGVLDKHGVDGSEFVNNLPQPPSSGQQTSGARQHGPHAGGRPPGGPPPGGHAGGARGHHDQDSDDQSTTTKESKQSKFI